jgi:hypothetical protein
MSVYERLYGKYKYGPPPPPPPPPVHASDSLELIAASSSSFQHRNPAEKSMNTSFAHTKAPAPSNKPIEGFNKSVQRMRAVNEERQKQKEMEENEWRAEDERYRKSR